jgi:hypothetical protein
LKDPSTSLLEEWHGYRKQHSGGYGYSQFTNLYGQWLSTKNLARHCRSRWAIALSTEDIKVLKEWRSLNNKRRWERAVALLNLHQGYEIPLRRDLPGTRQLERQPVGYPGYSRSGGTRRWAACGSRTQHTPRTDNVSSGRILGRVLLAEVADSNVPPVIGIPFHRTRSHRARSLTRRKQRSSAKVRRQPHALQPHACCFSCPHRWSNLLMSIAPNAMGGIACP